MLWFLLLQSTTTTCMVNGQYVTCNTTGAAPVADSQSWEDKVRQLSTAPADFADAVAEGRCLKMADRASKAGDHAAAAKILESCKAK